MNTQFKKSSLMLAIIASSFIGGNVLAADPINKELVVSVNVTSTCTVTDDLTIAFANLDPDKPNKMRSSDSIAPGAIKINCSDGTDYSISFKANNNYMNSNRHMKKQNSSGNNASNFIKYDLTKDKDGKQIISTTEKQKFIGTGGEDSIPIYAVIRKDTKLLTGSYTDIVPVVIEY